MLGAGTVVSIEGRNFDQLPANTVAWFYSNASSFTATSPLFVISPTLARAVVPSNQLVKGPGLVSLYDTQCVDCTSQGGSPDSCAGAWVNHRTLFPRVEFTHPLPAPLPVSGLRAIAVSDSEIDLSWQDNSSNEDYFEVLEGSDPSSTTHSLGTVPQNHTSEPITSLPPSTTRCYEVRAVNASGYQRVPDEAKACATTLQRSLDVGSVVIRNVGGANNTLCARTLSNVQLFAYEDRNGDGIIDAIGAPALPDPGPAWVEPNVGAVPPWDVFVADGYATGANMVVIANFQSCGRDDPQFAAVHLHWAGGTTVTPVFFLAGNYQEHTGPQLERIGAVMITDEIATNRLRYDPASGRLFGSARGVVTFQLTDIGTSVLYDYEADVTLDLMGGVVVVHE